MRLFNRRGFAALVALATLVLAAPIAYALANPLLLHIDPSQPASEIERAVKNQLDSNGIPASVSAGKDDDGNVSVRIQTADERVGSDLQIDVPDTTPDDDRELRVEIAREVQVELRLACALTDAQLQQLQTTLEGDRVSALLAERSAHTKTDPEVAAALTSLLAEHGFHAVQVTVDGGTIAVTVSAPPA